MKCSFDWIGDVTRTPRSGTCTHGQRHRELGYHNKWPASLKVSVVWPAGIFVMTAHRVQSRHKRDKSGRSLRPDRPGTQRPDLRHRVCERRPEQVLAMSHFTTIHDPLPPFQQKSDGTSWEDSLLKDKKRLRKEESPVL